MEHISNAGSESLESTAQVPIDNWLKGEAISFSLDSPEAINSAVDRLIASCGEAVELLGFGEALHGGKDILFLRNRLFQRLVEVHGYTAIATESSFPRARWVNEYVAGRGPASYKDIQETGFSHGFGRLEANQELVEWMRAYNAGSSQRATLRFYGFDSPTEMTVSDSPRQVLHFVLDYLASVDRDGSQERRERIDPLLSRDSEWDNPAALADPSKSIGLTPAASALRAETEDLITELHVRRPELVAKSEEGRYLEAAQYASVARQLLSYHAALARTSRERVAGLLGIRDAMMADNLEYKVSRERGRGKVLAFAHNTHLQRGKARWQWGTDLYTWWPAGSHLGEIFGQRYVVIGSAIGDSAANGIGPPEAGTLEARLTAMPGPARFVPTHKGKELPAISSLPTRLGSIRNLTYFALTPQCFTDFDWLAVLDSIA